MNSTECEGTLPPAREARGLLRRFRKRALQLSHGLRESPIEKLSFSLSWSEGENLQSTFEENEYLFRLATLLRPFLLSGSETELSSFCDLIQRLGADPESLARIRASLHAASSSRTGVEFNGVMVGDREIYDLYANGVLFNDDEQAKRRYDELAVGPMRQLIPFVFHSVGNA